MVRLRVHHIIPLLVLCAGVLFVALPPQPDEVAGTGSTISTAGRASFLPILNTAEAAAGISSSLLSGALGTESGDVASDAVPCLIGYDRNLGKYQSFNSRQNISVKYEADGFSSSSGDEHNGWNLDLRLQGISRGAEMLAPGIIADPAADPRVSVTGERMSVQHDGFRIDYTSGIEGMRQDFIVERRPAGHDHLRVHLRARGDLRPVIEGEDDALFVRGEGEHQEGLAWYRGLKAWDAEGRELAAHMEASGNLLALVVDDEGAEYPVTVDPTLADASWNTAAFVESAGDVNSDGYDDLLVSKDSTTLLFYGSPTGPDTVNRWTAAETVPGVYFMYGRNGVGDINNDGYDDVLLWGFTKNGSTLDYKRYLFYGSATGLGNSPGWTSGSSGGGGGEIEPAGDVNGDGYADVLMGLSIYHGSPSGLPATASTSLINASGAPMSSSAGAGDVNGDGYDDVIMGAEYYRSGLRWEEGVVYIYYGSATGVNPNHGWMVKGNISYARFGASVDGAGDVNGDGYDDVIAGIPGQFGTTDRGRAYVFFGSETGPPVTPGWITSSNPGVDGDTHGEAVAGAGDIDADGYDDVIVGAMDYYHRDFNGGYGEVFIYYGEPPGENRGADVISGTPTYDRLGTDVAAAGDVNGDGAADFFVRATGRTFLFNGTPSSASRTLTGVVVNHLGVPISSGSVMLDNKPAYRYSISSNGTFIFAGPLATGHHTLTVSASGYQTATFDLIMPDGDKHVVLGLVPSNVPPPPPPFTVCGTVTVTDGNGPVLSGVTVEILQSGSIVHETSTDADGEFCAIPLAPGNYQVRYSKTGYQTLTTDLVLDRNRQIVASLMPGNLE